MKLPYRPIINIPKSKQEKILDIIGIGFFISSILFVVLNWGNIPDEIPAHFNGAGEVDRWGSKYELIILPIIGTFLFIFMSVFERAPHMHNYPDRINESNAEQFYRHSRRLLNIVKNTCLAMFAYLIVQITRVAMRDIQSLGMEFTAVLLTIILGAVFYGLYKQTKIK